MTTSPSGNRKVTSVPPGSVSDPLRGGPGAQPPVQFIDPVTEDGQFVGTLYRLGRVAVIADHAPVVLDLDLQPIASLPQPGQLSREVIACRIR